MNSSIDKLHKEKDYINNYEKPKGILQYSKNFEASAANIEKNTALTAYKTSVMEQNQFFKRNFDNTFFYDLYR